MLRGKASQRVKEKKSDEIVKIFRLPVLIFIFPHEPHEFDKDIDRSGKKVAAIEKGIEYRAKQQN
jgi:hypothetical protein